MVGTTQLEILAAEKRKKLDAITSRYNKKAVKDGKVKEGHVILGRASDLAKNVPPRMKTGNRIMDYWIGGGLKIGTSSIWYGAKGVGKTSQAVVTAALQSREGKQVLWIQAEEGDIFELLKIHKANMDNIIIYNVEGSGQQCFELIAKFLEERGLVDLIFVDSLAGLSPKEEIEKLEKDGYDESTQSLGGIARMYANWYRSLHSKKLLSECHMVLISQVRDKISMYGGTDFVGGNATKHGPRLLLSFSSPNKGFLVSGSGESQKRVGHTVKCTMEKDGVTHKNQGRSFEFRVYYGKGIDNLSCIYDLLVELKGIGTGAWVVPSEELQAFYSGNREDIAKFHGSENVRKAIKENLEFRDACNKFIDSKMEITPEDDIEEAETAEEEESE